MQPPSGGCVLKLSTMPSSLPMSRAAAFGRLCVETTNIIDFEKQADAAAFGRLCVEAITLDRFEEILRQAAVSARLCVETLTH